MKREREKEKRNKQDTDTKGTCVLLMNVST